jgi:nanoRNase/pAp phosphatase (c-di-AMP/oligoRNAs hydrolase)
MDAQRRSSTATYINPGRSSVNSILTNEPNDSSHQYPNLTAKQSAFDVEDLRDADVVLLEDENNVEVGGGAAVDEDNTQKAVYDHHKVENDFTDHYDA